MSILVWKYFKYNYNYVKSLSQKILASLPPISEYVLIVKNLKANAALLS